uniref:Immunoglobulin domain-containing protein n=1 Tax=Electrophorus electricus TaxID=8005 RepID=A0A4W4GX14_ELEEL
MVGCQLYIVVFFASSYIGAITAVTGYTGQSVQIRCPYESGYETHTKYLCRGPCSILSLTSKDIPVQSGSVNKDERFSLNDDTAARVFTVTITDLRSEDGGTYWCAIQRTLRDIYTEVELLLFTLKDLSASSHCLTVCPVDDVCGLDSYVFNSVSQNQTPEADTELDDENIHIGTTD